MVRFFYLITSLLLLFCVNTFADETLRTKCRFILPELLETIRFEENGHQRGEKFNQERIKMFLSSLDQSDLVIRALADIYELHDQNEKLMQLQTLLDIQAADELVQRDIEKSTHKVNDFLKRLQTTYPELFKQRPERLRWLTQNPFIIVEENEKTIEELILRLLNKKVLFEGQPVELRLIFGIHGGRSPHAWKVVAQIAHELHNTKIPPPVLKFSKEEIPNPLLNEMLSEVEFAYHFLFIQKNKAAREALTESEKKRIEKSYASTLNDLELRIRVLKSFKPHSPD